MSSGESVIEKTGSAKLNESGNDTNTQIPLFTSHESELQV